MELIFTWQSNANDKVERALSYDKPEEAARFSQDIEAANRVLESFVLRCHGRVLDEQGSSGSAQISSEYLGDLPDVLKQVEGAGYKFSIGVGVDSSEALIARRAAEKRGGGLVLYTPDLSEEESSDDEISDDEADLLDLDFENKPELGKAEQKQPGEATKIVQGDISPTAAQPSPPPSASPYSPSPAQEPQQQQPSEEDVLKAIGQVLSQFKEQIPFFEQQVKKANPQAYEAVMDMVQGMIALAKKVAQEPPIQKSEAQTAIDIHPPPGAAYCDSCDRIAENCVCGKGKVELQPHEKIPSSKELKKLYDTFSGQALAMAELNPNEDTLREFEVGFRQERKEHPHLDDHQTTMTVLQHLAEDPKYYTKISALEESGMLGKDEAVAKQHHLNLPPGSQGVGAKAKSKKVIEPVTGKASWHMMSSGQKMSGDGHALSTRVKECPSADTPERRAQQAGLTREG